MLKRLYEPILWRCLDSVNNGIRVNALTLLIDAFPIKDADDDTDELLQQQFDLLYVILISTYGAGCIERRLCRGATRHYTRRVSDLGCLLGADSLASNQQIS